MVRSVRGTRPTPAQIDQSRAAARANHGPTHGQIAVRAFQIFEARGCRPGFALQDWTQAERELRRNGFEIVTCQG